MSMQDITRLCNIVKEHPSINILGLGNCLEAEVNGYEVLQKVMTAGVKKLRDINFCGNLIRTGGDTFISDCIRNNDSRLDTLKLETTLLIIMMQEHCNGVEIQ